VLLAGLFAEGTTRYIEPIATRTHTETMLAFCGVYTTNCTVTKYTPNALDVTIPNDISSASFLMALALLTNQSITLPNVGINEGRVGFLDVAKRAGAQIFVENVRTSFGELVADIRVEKGTIGPLFATPTDVINAIDEIPILSVLALATQGAHRFKSVAELMHKECNRIDAIIDMAHVCGQTATFDGQNLTIVSNGKLPTKPHFHSFGDHRMAMCACVMSLACGGGSVDSFPVEVSFPNFLDALTIHPKKFCVIGSNVTQSKSPMLHMTLAKNANVCCSYDVLNLPADVSNDQLLQTISDYDGANITLPFKNRVANLFGASMPSVNTVGKGIAPTSTDGFGVMQALLANGIDITNKAIWIVGAGGGAEATIVELLGKCQMQVINRTAENAHVLTKKYNLSTDITQPYGILTFVPECEFEQNLMLPSSCQFVFVSAYNGTSGLRNKANKRGIKVVDGLQMLYHQGAKSFALWTNTPIQQDYQQFRDFLSKENLL
jgi:shikimate 5-dehydrogenase